VRDALIRAGLIQQTDPNLWNKDKPWVANVKQIGNGQRPALYLSRYVYRVALSNHRIERFEHDQVTFRYTHALTHQTRRITLPVQHFIARFLQHVLPRGFTKIRYYGLLSSASRKDLDRARSLLESAASQIPPPPAPPVEATGQECSTAEESTPPPPPLRLCPVCKRGHLHLETTIPRPRAPP